MKPCRYRTVLAIVFVLLAALPFIQKGTKLFPTYPLHGRENRVKKPTWTLSSIFSGEAARQFEAYFSQKVGFRGRVVRGVNQFNFSVFGKITGNMGTPVILGDDYWLYEKEYVKHYSRVFGINNRSRLEFVNGLKELQDKLEAHGIAFVLLISPSKPEIYPEHLPEKYQGRIVKEPSKRAYLMTKPELIAAGVNVFDVRELFEALKPTTPFLFPKTGTHWSYYGSYLACRALLQELNDKRDLGIAIPQLDNLAMGPPIGTDSDLLQILNLLWFDPSGQLQPYPKVSVEAAPMTDRLDILVVGDSFSFTLIDSLNLCRAANNIDLHYYFKRYYHYPSTDAPGYMMDHVGADAGSIDRESVNWQDLLLKKDLVILEMNEIMLSSRGWGFIKAATAQLHTPGPQTDQDGRNHPAP